MTPEIQQYIDKKIDETMRFSAPKYGDTPTDVLQLANKKYVDSHSYAGTFDNTGSNAVLPAGWSVVKNSTGNYTVTHNLGTTAYAVAALSTSDLPVISNVPSAADSFTIVVRNISTGSPTDSSISFLLTKIV